MVWTSDTKITRKPSEIFISLWPLGEKPFATTVASNTELYSYISKYLDENSESRCIFKILVSSTKIEVLTEGLEKRFGKLDFRVIPHKIHETIHFLPSQNQLTIEHGGMSAKPKNEDRNQEKPNELKKVMIVDDSTTILTLLERIIEQSDEFEICAKVSDPRNVLGEIEKCKPDVMTLDMHMPNLNGVQVIEQVLPKYKIPIVLFTSLRLEEGPLVFKALEKGAVDYLRKPDGDQLEKSKNQLLSKLKIAVKARIIDKKVSRPRIRITDSLVGLNLICIGASTGGTTALMNLMSQLPKDCPPIVIVQHIPSGFSNSFATNLNRVSRLRVVEAEDGMALQDGCCYVAPGGYQMKLLKSGDSYILNVNNDDPDSQFQPSIDYFFKSVAQSFQSKGIGIIMTGMGRDGAEGLLALKKTGFTTLAQDESTSVVFGMPKEAGNIGAVEDFVALEDFPRKFRELAVVASRKKIS